LEPIAAVAPRELLRPILDKVNQADESIRYGYDFEDEDDAPAPVDSKM
jgi:hypothetical protein